MASGEHHDLAQQLAQVARELLGAGDVLQPLQRMVDLAVASIGGARSGGPVEGMSMTRSGVDDDQAFEVLRDASNRMDTNLRESPGGSCNTNANADHARRPWGR